MRQVILASAFTFLTVIPLMAAPLPSHVRISLEATIADVSGGASATRSDGSQRLITPREIDDNLEPGAGFFVEWTLDGRDLVALRRQGLDTVTLCTNASGLIEDDPCMAGSDRRTSAAVVDLYPDDGPFAFGRSTNGGYGGRPRGPTIDLRTGAITTRMGFSAQFLGIAYDTAAGTLTKVLTDSASVAGEIDATGGAWRYDVPVIYRTADGADLDHTDTIDVRWAALWSSEVVATPAPGGVALLGVLAAATIGWRHRRVNSEGVLRSRRRVR